MLEEYEMGLSMQSVQSRTFLIYHIVQYGPNLYYSISYAQEASSLYGAVPVCRVAKTCCSKPHHQLDLKTFDY
jgi:hypothetical protein